MKKYINIALSVLMAASAVSCSKDNPFEGAMDSSTGKLLKSSLAVSVENEKGPRSLRNRNVRMAVPAAGDFAVDFIREGETEPTLSYARYSEMPEIVVLPVGDYTAVAHYGHNLEAAWENPYYEGSSTVFRILKDDITDDVEPIVCSLSNVRVSVAFDSALLAVMSPDCKVNVKVGDKGSLDFTASDADRSGYFAFVEGSRTLAAVFTGVVDGGKVNEIKTYEDVKPGNHYKITFRLHDAGEEDPGQITGKGDSDIIVVDAKVETENMNQEDLEDGETTIPDTMRPQEGEPEGGDPEQPGPDDPVDPAKPAPEITAQDPVVLCDNASEDKWNVIEIVNKSDDNPTGDSKYPIVLNISSSAPGGIKTFKVKIVSTHLTPEELGDFGLATEMDLVTPGDCEESLSLLGFPVNVGGMTAVEFNITNFIPMLGALGPGEEGLHEFTLTVGDANGTTVKVLKLKKNK